MGTEGKVMVVDMLLRGTPDMLVDLHLFVSNGGQVPTEAEWSIAKGIIGAGIVNSNKKLSDPTRVRRNCFSNWAPIPRSFPSYRQSTDR